MGSSARRFSSWTRSGIGICAYRFNREAGALLQRLVDGDRGLGALGGRDNGKLHVARGIADDVQAGNMGLTERSGLDRAALVHFAAKARGDLALLALARAEED